MSDKKSRFIIADLSGGRNAIDPPTSPRFKDNQCLDAVNVDWYRAPLGNKRNGLTSSLTTFSSGGPFSGFMGTLFRHVPGTSEAAAECWAVSEGAGPIIGRKAAATTFTQPTLKDGTIGNGWDYNFASSDGKLFVAYQNSTVVNRLHVWDGSTVRRTGIDPGAVAPTAADSGGAGAYAVTLGYWRTRFITQSGGITIRRSEATPAVQFTPSGVNASVTITRPTAPNEGETHWELELSLDGVSFVVVFGDRGYLGTAAVAIATTTATTNIPVTTLLAAGFAAPLTGTYGLQKAYRFIRADQGRLVGFGSFVSTDRQNDIEVSGVIGSLNQSDTERVDQTQQYRYTLDENDSGAPRGLQGPVFGNFYAFKDKQTWELAPTGFSNNPYRVTKVFPHIGCVFWSASAIGENELGNPALYFFSHRGVYRYGDKGLEYIGKGIEDYVLGPTATINLAATKIPAHMVYHTDKRQLWAWWATGSSDMPTVGAIYDVVSGGWSRIPAGDKLASASCSVLWPSTIGVTMAKTLLPYIGSSASTTTIYKCDDSSVTQDDGTNFAASITTKPFEPGGPGFNGKVGDMTLTAKVAAGVTITATVTRDFGAESQPGTALLTLTADEGSATRVNRRLEGSAFAGAQFLQVTLGDAAAVSNAWTLDRLTIPYERQESVGGG